MNLSYLNKVSLYVLIMIKMLGNNNNNYYIIIIKLWLKLD